MTIVAGNVATLNSVPLDPGCSPQIELLPSEPPKVRPEFHVSPFASVVKTLSDVPFNVASA